MSEATTETPVETAITLETLASEFGKLVAETRGSLYAMGNKVMAWGKAKGMDKASAIVEAIVTEGTLKGLKFDRAFITRATTASRNGKLAGKHGVFAEWKAAATDKAAQEILDKAQGITRKAPTTKSDLQRALALVDKLDDSALRAILGHIRSKILATQTADKANSELEAVA